MTYAKLYHDGLISRRIDRRSYIDGESQQTDLECHDRLFEERPAAKSLSVAPEIGSKQKQSDFIGLAGSLLEYHVTMLKSPSS